ncbi:MAG TPA: polysaccharide deacetylase family protein [Dermatophilaceae bacterium]|nr:polysaccharide deacetylase family protein [Dermatophilaceae bacterium]
MEAVIGQRAPDPIPGPSPSTDGAPKPTPTTSGIPAPTTTPSSPSTNGCRTPGRPATVTRAKHIALTFDDGPFEGTTQEVVAILRRYGVKATFFDVGSMAQSAPGALRAVHLAGHDIANHTWDHPDLRKLTPAAVEDQLTRTARQIEATTKTWTCFARAPYGATNPTTDAVMAKLGYRKVGWNLDPRDWEMPGVEAIVAKSTNVAPGAPVTLLLHVRDVDPILKATTGAATQTVAALPRIIAFYQARGYAFVRVDGSAFPHAEVLPPVLSAR